MSGPDYINDRKVLTRSHPSETVEVKSGYQCRCSDPGSVTFRALKHGIDFVTESVICSLSSLPQLHHLRPRVAW